MYTKQRKWVIFCPTQIETNGQSKSMYRRIFNVFLACFWLPACLLSACSPLPQITATPTRPAQTATPTQTPGPTFTPTPQSSPTPSPQPTATPNPSDQARTGYALAVQFDYTNKFLSATEKIHYPNTTGAALQSIELMVEPNHFSGVFNLKSALWADGSAIAGVKLDAHLLTIPLPTPLAANAAIDFDLAFTLQIPAIPPPSDTSRPIPFGYTARQINLVDWYPYVAAYQSGAGWLVHDAWYYGEHQVYPCSDVSVDLSLVDPPAGLVIAASAPAIPSGDHQTYTLPAARTFSFSASASYQTASQTVGGVTVTSYYFPLDEPPGLHPGQQALQDTAQAVQLYSQLFGPYPHASLAVVEADFLDGMEYDGLYFLSHAFYSLYDGTPKGYLTAIAVHETAHQWWYGVVGNDQAIDPWLDEAMATYTECIYYEKTHPELVDWWWSFRVTFYQPVGWVNHAIYDYGGYTPYRNAVYLRGAQFLADLRKTVGDEAFFAFLKDYATTYTRRQASPKEFFDLLAKHSQADLSGVLHTYFDPALPIR
jgi:hypothetical protein